MRHSIIVKTNSKKSEIVGFDETKQAYIVSVKAEPEKGKANMEVVKLFTKEFKRPVKIVIGFTSKKKIIEVS